MQIQSISFSPPLHKKKYLPRTYDDLSARVLGTQTDPVILLTELTLQGRRTQLTGHHLPHGVTDPESAQREFFWGTQGAVPTACVLSRDDHTVVSRQMGVESSPIVPGTSQVDRAGQQRIITP